MRGGPLASDTASAAAVMQAAPMKWPPWLHCNSTSGRPQSESPAILTRPQARARVRALALQRAEPPPLASLRLPLRLPPACERLQRDETGGE